MAAIKNTDNRAGKQFNGGALAQHVQDPELCSIYVICIHTLYIHIAI
jgi:hypothetical protein